ncbi:hypothetical protein SNOG_05645 [Parastagonospora nodorum SN15]|uniref:Uncharacterized protein n=1 Tax=Phaeosphaeria nodorum (strain SN15 / ATCC MYA-4574 / FGSC 10173) TaxID=321614 RepID=Q0URG9_PHANO|nr:hypothetical protein SNOG_05645 [Parastagonospora nodorum SN15]EAT86709.1 hypothetical protein SNOG_05645 [Parastagonospora nodorum SN15]
MWLKQRFSHHWPGRGLAQHGPHLYRQPRLRRTEPLANGRLSEIPFRNVQASFTPDSRQSYSVHMRKQAFDDDNTVSKNGTDASRVQPICT